MRNRKLETFLGGALQGYFGALDFVSAGGNFTFLLKGDVLEITLSNNPAFNSLTVGPSTLNVNGGIIMAEDTGITFGSAGDIINTGGLIVVQGTMQFDTNVQGMVSSGTYTPTLTNVANLDASTAYVCQWMRVNNVVTVSGKVDVDCTTTSNQTQLGISLPIASALASEQQCGGVGAFATVSSSPMAIRGDATNDRAEMAWRASNNANTTVHFTFTYLIV